MNTQTVITKNEYKTSLLPNNNKLLYLFFLWKEAKVMKTDTYFVVLE